VNPMTPRNAVCVCTQIETLFILLGSPEYLEKSNKGESGPQLVHFDHVLQLCQTGATCVSCIKQWFYCPDTLYIRQEQQTLFQQILFLYFSLHSASGRVVQLYYIIYRTG
jgi:hypothetical protein